MAMGGSTNAIIHVVAMARRAGSSLDMKRFDDLSREVPVLANVRPSGEFLMEDFFYAGGLRSLMAELRDKLDLSCLTVTGKTIGENIAGAEVYQRDVIRSLCDPVSSEEAGRADRQSGAARLRDEAVGGGKAAAASSRQGDRL